MLRSLLFFSPTLSPHHPSLPLSPTFPHKPHIQQTRLKAQLTDPTTTTTTVASSSTALLEDGPIELPNDTSIFATTDDPTPLQIATSLLLTGAISVFLFRSLRRRARRAKELKFRSTGPKSIKDEALENLKAMKLAAPDPEKPPSPVQALLGGIAAGVITLILYKFATTVETGLNRQTISDNFSVRQITITVRTIINGICYLATFVFGINSIGLVLYSGQLALNSFMEGSTSKETSGENDGKLDTNPTNSSVENKEFSNNEEDKSDKSQ